MPRRWHPPDAPGRHQRRRGTTRRRRARSDRVPDAVRRRLTMRRRAGTCAKSACGRIGRRRNRLYRHARWRITLTLIRLSVLPQSAAVLVSVGTSWRYNKDENSNYQLGCKARNYLELFDISCQGMSSRTAASLADQSEQSARDRGREIDALRFRYCKTGAARNTL